MTHCHFPKGEWLVTVNCPVFAHIAPTEGEGKEGRREWGVSPHTVKGEGTSQEGRGDTAEGATTGGERDDNIHENRTQNLRPDPSPSDVRQSSEPRYHLRQTNSHTQRSDYNLANARISAILKQPS